MTLCFTGLGGALAPASCASLETFGICRPEQNAAVLDIAFFRSCPSSKQVYALRYVILLTEHINTIDNADLALWNLRALRMELYSGTVRL